MNLRTRIDNRTTATVQIISDTECIFSDEVSNDIACLHIIKANDKGELWTKIQDFALLKASKTRFPARINLVANGENQVISIGVKK